MALVQKKISRAKQVRLAAMFAAVIGATLAVAYFGLIRKKSPKSIDTSTGQRFGEYSRVIVPRESGFEATEELRNNDLFQRLQSFGIWPLSLEPKGKTQPFIKKDIEQEE